MTEYNVTKIPRLSGVVVGAKRYYKILLIAKPVVFPFLATADRSLYDALLTALLAFINSDLIS